MARHIVVIQGHPDSSREHFCHALASAYAEGVREAGHELKLISVADLEFPLLRTHQDFYEGKPPPVIQQCQEDIRWADHLVIIYPLWMGSMPALLKGFMEQVFRLGFAMTPVDGGKKWIKLLKGRSAHVVITMGMPAFVYRWVFGAHSLKSLEKNILRFVGIAPVRESLVGMVEASTEKRQSWLRKMRKLGAAGS